MKGQIGTFEGFFDKLAWTAITAIGIYAATQLKDMSKSINELTTSTAVILDRVKTQGDNIKGIDDRVRFLENH